MTEQALKKELIDISASLCGLLEKAEKGIPDVSGDAFADWNRTCERCRKRLDDDLLRTGVVGTIKSGKSTFINAVFEGDYLKRGAGVITSIVTRVRRSDRLRATLTFKSWQEINSEVRHALGMFASNGWRNSGEPFDIRKDSDRAELARALKNLESRHLLNHDTRSVGNVLLNAGLKGYPRVKNIVSERPETVVFTGKRFYEHQDFAGSEDLSVFLKDLCLEIDSGSLAANIEIADCQGSDSPNPLHLAMIQNYLRSSDLIIYLISSRTGIRQADLNFMSIIRQIGGMGNVVFVVNFDFNEHENLTDLERVSRKIKEDLSLVTESPAVYTFSSLYALFGSIAGRLPEKDRARLSQWESEEEMAEFSRKERSRFQADFRRMITEQRYSLLLRNHLQRLQTTAGDFRHWLMLNREIFSADAEGADSLMKRIKQQQKKTEKIRSMIKSTILGASQQLKKEMKSAVDRFFDIRHGEVVPGIMDFISGYSISYERYRSSVAEDGFADTLFAVFQDFREQLDRYMAETVNPKLFRFARENEEYIKDYFESIARPYETMVREALMEFQKEARDDKEPDMEGRPEHTPICLDSVKKAHDIEIPDAAATLAYSRGLKTEAFMKLGYFRFLYGVRRLLKRGDSSASADISALKSGVAGMKRETRDSIVFHFKNYRENLKFQYLFSIVDSVASEINNWLVYRFQTYSTDFDRISEIAGRDRADREKVLETIDSVLADLDGLVMRLEKLQSELRPSPVG
ncbi:MAG: dynamin family protein [Desulfobacteraceae bacterium]|nr:dynamin family protein [Desulfobacteraceae bacterium]